MTRDAPPEHGVLRASDGSLDDAPLGQDDHDGNSHDKAPSGCGSDREIVSEVEHRE